jgi:hypothetical protein
VSDTPALSIPIRVDGMDSFRASMNTIASQASTAVGRVESAFANLKPDLGGLAKFGVAIGGSVAAVTGLLAALQSINSELTAIGQAARYLNTTTDTVQKLQFAGMTQGIGSDQALSDLQNVGKLLNDAQRNENSLTKLLDANNIAYKNRAGELISINDLLGKGADLVKNAGSFADKVEIAKMLGLTQQWVPALERGALGFQKIADGATDAGAVIDSQTIAKAELFDAAWKRSSAAFATQFKAGIVEVASYLDDLIVKAQNFLADINTANGVSTGSGQTKFNAMADALQVAAREAAGLPQDLDQVSRVLDNLIQKGADPGIIAGITELQQKAQAAADALQAAAEAESKLNYPGGVPLPASRPSSADVNANPTKIPARNDGNDRADSAINSLRRHTEQTEADAKAVGLGAAALAQFRAEAQETAAVQANGGKETAEQAKAFNELEQRAGAAAEALAKAEVNSQIGRGRQTAFLDPEDAQIASQLSKVYGDDIPRALNSSEAAAMRLNNTLKQSADAFSSALNGPLVDFETGSKNATQALQSFASSFSRSLLQMANQALIVRPLLSGIGGLFGVGGSGSTPVMSGSDLGAGTGGLSFPMFAGGTDSAPGGLAWVGERGPELVNLPHGSQVIPNETSMKLARDIPGYADGGVIGGGKPAPLFGTTAGPSFVMGDIHVHGANGGTPAQNKALGEAIAAQVKQAAGEFFFQQMRQATRPGGMLKG